jgi:hypothetical protein
MRTLLLTGLIVGVVGVAGLGQTKYGVKVDVDRKADFAGLKTYAWSTRYSAVDPAVHAQVVAAIERQLAALGFTKQEAGPADVLVVYDAQRRTDVDLKGPASKEGERPTFPVGTLVVRLLDPASGRALYHARLDKPMSVDRERLAGEIDAAVASLFEKYPGRPRGKS